MLLTKFTMNWDSVSWKPYMATPFTKNLQAED